MLNSFPANVEINIFTPLENHNDEFINQLKSFGTVKNTNINDSRFFIVDNKDQFISNPEFQLNNHVKVMSRIYEQ